jgi:general secretion pathway protein L
MFKLNDRVNVDVARFLRWWGGELAALAPERLRKLLIAQRACLILRKPAQALEMAYQDAEGLRPLAPLSLDAEGAQQREALLQASPFLAEAELLLQLAPGQSLQKTFKLPLAAEENLRQVVGFEMDRLTPFKAEQVYFSVKVLERLPEAKQLRVDLALVPRPVLDELLDELALCGWRPSRVDVGAEPGGSGHDLLPERFRAASSRLPRHLAFAAAAVAAVLAGAVLIEPIMVKGEIEEELRRELKAAAKTAKEVDALRDTAEKQAHQAVFLLRKKRQEPAMVDMLEELSRVIPDQTMLNGLQYRDRRVIMQGQSPAASSLIELLEASPYFKNTSFVSPVTKDVASGQERFQIACEVLNGRTADEKPAQ